MDPNEYKRQAELQEREAEDMAAAIQAMVSRATAAYDRVVQAAAAALETLALRTAGVRRGASAGMHSALTAKPLADLYQEYDVNKKFMTSKAAELRRAASSAEPSSYADELAASMGQVSESRHGLPWLRALAHVAPDMRASSLAVAGMTSTFSTAPQPTFMDTAVNWDITEQCWTVTLTVHDADGRRCTFITPDDIELIFKSADMVISSDLFDVNTQVNSDAAEVTITVRVGAAAVIPLAVLRKLELEIVVAGVHWKPRALTPRLGFDDLTRVENSDEFEYEDAKNVLFDISAGRMICAQSGSSFLNIYENGIQMLTPNFEDADWTIHHVQLLTADCPLVEQIADILDDEEVAGLPADKWYLMLLLVNGDTWTIDVANTQDYESQTHRLHTFGLGFDGEVPDGELTWNQRFESMVAFTYREEDVYLVWNRENGALEMNSLCIMSPPDDSFIDNEAVTWEILNLTRPAFVRGSPVCFNSGNVVYANGTTDTVSKYSMHSVRPASTTTLQPSDNRRVFGVSQKNDLITVLVYAEDYEIRTYKGGTCKQIIKIKNDLRDKDWASICLVTSSVDGAVYLIYVDMYTAVSYVRVS